MTKRASKQADAERELPAALGAERAILSALLARRATVREVALPRRAFFAAQHGRIFTAIEAVVAAGRPVEPAALSAELRRANEPEARADMALVGELLESAPRVSEIAEQVNIVREKAALRWLVYVSAAVEERASTGAQGAAEIAGEAIAEFQEVIKAATNKARGRKARPARGGGERIGFVAERAER